MYCPACGMEGGGMPGEIAVCLGCDAILKVPELAPEQTEPTALWFEQIQQRDVPIKMLLLLERLREKIRQARRAVA